MKALVQILTLIQEFHEWSNFLISTNLLKKKGDDHYYRYQKYFKSPKWKNMYEHTSAGWCKVDLHKHEMLRETKNISR